MNTLYTLGIDIGGTHIDLVAVDSNNNIIALHKEPTSVNLELSLLTGIKIILEKNLDVTQCKNIHLGTTVALNSLLELKGLYRVGVLRIAGHNPELPPAFNFPQVSRAQILAHYTTIQGGYEHDNRKISNFDEQDVVETLDLLVSSGAESIAITGVFSPLYSQDEELVAQYILASKYKDIPITLSHHLGGIGFIERENNTIINAALKKVLSQHFTYLENELQKLGFNCGVLVVQNNGTLMSLETAMHYPIKTISSGPTNSLIGACKLANLTDAIVIDIGGTSTEIGVVENGFPRYSSSGALIAGIPTNFMLPNIQVLALGGGSIIRIDAENKYTIGPDSLGAKLFTYAQSFNGPHLTVFDIANILQEQSPKYGISITMADAIMRFILNQLNNHLENIYLNQNMPIIFVGGGAQNLPEDYIKQHIRPDYYQVANAYGAALAEICGTIDEIHTLEANKDEIIQQLELKAIEQAVHNGARHNRIRIIEKRLLPFFYMENQLTRIIITAAGGNC